MRLFTALDPPQNLRVQCRALQDAISLPGRRTPVDQLHVTVRFLGDTDPDRATQYEAALSSLEGPPAHCVAHGLDVLPSRRNPRVVVMGLRRTDSLLALYEKVSDALGSHGLAPEDRTYRPHLTLVRLEDPDPAQVQETLGALDDSAPAAFVADTLHLYESTLTEDGAVHERRSSFPLSAPAP